MNEFRGSDSKMTLEQLCLRGVLLADYTSFQIGGTADYFAVPETIQELLVIIEYAQKIGMPYFTFGNGSNILFPDTPGTGKLFISLTRLLELKISYDEKGFKIHMHAGVPLSYLALIGIKYDISKLLFTHLLPGTLGAGIYINAKCYDDQMSDILEKIYYIDTENIDAGIQTINVQECQFCYKQSIFQKKSWIIAGADIRITANQNIKELLELEKPLEINLDVYKQLNTLELKKFYQHFTSSANELAAMLGKPMPEKLVNIDIDRNLKHHFSYPSCGSVFKNNYNFGKPMGALIDQLQLKGKQHGGAMISPYHGNFIVNYQNAKAADVEYLISYVQEAVNNKFGFVPEPEVVIVR